MSDYNKQLSAAVTMLLGLVVERLRLDAGPEDSASVQINDSGAFIVRVGVTHTERMNVEQFADYLVNK